MADDVQLHVWCNYRQAIYFFVGEETVGYLYDTFLAQFLAYKVVSDSNVRIQMLQVEQ